MSKKDSSTPHEAFDRLFYLLVDLKVVDPPEAETIEESQELRSTASIATDQTVLPEALRDLPFTDAKQDYCDPSARNNSGDVASELITSELSMSELSVSLQPEMAFSRDSGDSKLLSSDEALRLLQALLVDPKLDQLREQIQSFKQQVEYQLYEPEQLIELMLPLIAEVLQRKTTQPHDDLAQAIAPMMGQAIKKQIQIEPDAIVDALYPIIGGTISKYLAETVQAINQQIENSLSVEGIQRKIQAKLKGVSEAELILQKATPLSIQAAFLIHKTSGLIISEMQRSDEQQLESDMIAGMLTAIRSFANDCIVQTGQTSELNEIDYGSSKIILEVAGYCYLAIVIQGEPTRSFLLQVREVFGSIVQQHGETIEQFDGDYAKVPAAIPVALSSLSEVTLSDESKGKKPSLLAVLGLGLLGSILIPSGIGLYHSHLQQRIETAFAITPELAIYHLSAEAWFGKLKLSGQLPNAPLRDRAGQIVRATLPNWSIDNQVTVVDVPADSVLAEAEVKRVTAVLNQTLRLTIAAVYQNAQVSVEGTVTDHRDAKQITQAYQRIPGVKSVINTVRIQPIIHEVRIDFATDSAIVPPDQIRTFKTFLQQHPDSNFVIVGYSSELPLAIARAQSVRALLVRQGIAPARLQVTGSDQPPLNSNQDSRRCAILKAV